VRTLIRNATVVDGSGAPPQEGVTLAIDDHQIAGVIARPSPYYDRADEVLDARGGFVLPGAINHHVHGLTRGPLMISGEPALSDRRVQLNCDTLLSQGVTRACNVDGFCLVEEAVASSRFPGLTVRVSSLQTPAHFAWTAHGDFPLHGILPRHRAATMESELAAGSVAIGEIGPGIDTHWADYTLLPLALEREQGIKLGIEDARRLRRDAESGDVEAVAAGLRRLGSQEDFAGRFGEIVAETMRWREQAEAACREAIAAAEGLPDVPVIMHHTPGTFELALSAAERLGDRLIAAHSNFQIHDPEVAVDHARQLKERGARIDIMSGDAFGAREFHRDFSVTSALIGSGLVDLISTDYAGGFWDPMLLVVEKAVEHGATTLQDGVRMVTSNVAEAVPRLAPSRGRLDQGMVADVAVTAPGSLSDIRAVFVSGVPVQLPQI
jgi:predicted amidohydrolase